MKLSSLIWIDVNNSNKRNRSGLNFVYKNKKNLLGLFISHTKSILIYELKIIKMYKTPWLKLLV